MKIKFVSAYFIEHEIEVDKARDIDYHAVQVYWKSDELLCDSEQICPIILWADKEGLEEELPERVRRILKRV